MSYPSEPARTREGGTEVIVAATYDEMIEAARRVTQTGYAKVNGELLDTTTANMIMNIHDALNDKNRDASRRMFERILNQAASLDLPPTDARRMAMRRTIDLFWKFA